MISNQIGRNGFVVIYAKDEIFFINRRGDQRDNIVNEVFDNAGLRVAFDTRTVTLHSKALKLTSIEYGLLSSLIKNAGRVLTMRQILREVWGTENEEKSNSARVYLNHLRQKIEENPSSPKRIINEPGIGYRFNLL